MNHLSTYGIPRNAHRILIKLKIFKYASKIIEKLSKFGRISNKNKNYILYKRKKDRKFQGITQDELKSKL